MKVRKYIRILAALLLTFSLPGCARQAPEVQSTIRVGFSHAEVENPWRMAQINSFRQNMESAGYTFVYTEPLEKTVQWQIENIRQMLKDGLDFLFLVPLDTEGYEEVVAQAGEQGTQVIALGQPLGGLTSGEDYLSCVYYDYNLAGRLCGEALLNRDGEVGGNILEIRSSNPSIAEPVSSGFREVISQTRDMEIVYTITADGDRIATQKLLERTIIELHQAGITIHAVFAHNDEDGLGALNALKLAGMNLEEIPIVSINGEQDVFKAIIAGEYLAAVTCSPMTGSIAGSMIELYLDGHNISPYVLIPCLRVDGENAIDSYLNAY